MEAGNRRDSVCVHMCGHVCMHAHEHACVYPGQGTWGLVAGTEFGMSSQTVAFLDVLRKEMFSSGTG